MKGPPMADKASLKDIRALPPFLFHTSYAGSRHKLQQNVQRPFWGQANKFFLSIMLKF